MPEPDKPGLKGGPTSGTAPLVVEFQGRGDGAAWFGGAVLSFGDGASEQLCLPGNGCGAVRTRHTYERPGRYEAVFAPVSEGADVAPFGRLVIEVRGGT